MSDLYLARHATEGIKNNLTVHFPDAHESIDNVVSHVAASPLVSIYLLDKDFNQNLLDLGSQHLTALVLIMDFL